MSYTIDGSGDVNNFPDIHRASDGKLIKYGITTRYTANEKHAMINTLIHAIDMIANEKIKEYGMKGLKIIQTDIGTHFNYQSTDKLHADDILAEIHDMLLHEKDDEVSSTAINHICEQMYDMIVTSGTCPAGRANRLFEIYMFLRDYNDKVHIPTVNRLS